MALLAMAMLFLLLSVTFCGAESGTLAAREGDESEFAACTLDLGSADLGFCAGGDKPQAALLPSVLPYPQVLCCGLLAGPSDVIFRYLRPRGPSARAPPALV